MENYFVFIIYFNFLMKTHPGEQIIARMVASGLTLINLCLNFGQN